jgi:hypothetical protein
MLTCSPAGPAHPAHPLAGSQHCLQRLLWLDRLVYPQMGSLTAYLNAFCPGLQRLRFCSGCLFGHANELGTGSALSGDRCGVPCSRPPPGSVTLRLSLSGSVSQCQAGTTVRVWGFIPTHYKPHTCTQNSGYRVTCMRNPGYHITCMQNLGFSRYPVPHPSNTCTLCAGYGYLRGRVRVALGYPRVTRDNHYPSWSGT